MTMSTVSGTTIHDAALDDFGWPRSGSLADELRSGPVLVALSAGSDAFGAIAVAEAIEQRYGGAVHSVYVFGHPRLALPARVPSAWAVHLDVGRAVNGILRCAYRTSAALIALGLRRHGVIDRLLHEETVLGVARQAAAPTLAVVPGLHGFPRRAVVAVDFSAVSVRAAQAALDLMAWPVADELALLRLAYVDSSSLAGTPADSDDALVTRLGIEAAFEALVGELDVPPYVRIDSTVLHGSRARALLTFAADSDADLIAIGLASPERAAASEIGDVTRAVMRAARYSVLVTPRDR